MSSFRTHYVQLKQTNMFSHLSQSQLSFKEAKIALNVINSLKEVEHYLKEITNDPDSLIDIDGRQNYRRGLTYVTDMCFKTCTRKPCQIQHVPGDSSLYEKTSHFVVTRLHSENVEYFHENTLENIVCTSAQIYQIYNILVQKYFMVLFAQFRCNGMLIRH